MSYSETIFLLGIRERKKWVEKVEGIRLYFCDEKGILEIRILSVFERKNLQGQRWGESSCKEHISEITGSILQAAWEHTGKEKVLLTWSKKRSPEKKPVIPDVPPSCSSLPPVSYKLSSHALFIWCMQTPGSNRIWLLLFHYKNVTDIFFFSFQALSRSRFNFRAIYPFRLSSLSSVYKSALISIFLFF